MFLLPSNLSLGNTRDVVLRVPRRFFGSEPDDWQLVVRGVLAPLTDPENWIDGGDAHASNTPEAVAAEYSKALLYTFTNWGTDA